MTCRYVNDSQIYERLLEAEKDAWQFVKAAEKMLAEANLEWENVTTAKRLFEDGVIGEEKYDSHQRTN